jgi:hypothetical protein
MAVLHCSRPIKVPRGHNIKPRITKDEPRSTFNGVLLSTSPNKGLPTIPDHHSTFTTSLALEIYHMAVLRCLRPIKVQRGHNTKSQITKDVELGSTFGDL